MKIVAKSKDKFFLTATEKEIYQLAGFASSYEEGAKGVVVEIGYDICISPMFQKIQDLKKMQDRLEWVKKTLRGMADELAPIEPILASLKTDE